MRERRRPRVETHPPYVDTYGAEAAELMTAAGQPLDDWQRDAVDLLLAVRSDGKWSCFEYCEIVPRQNGKGAILEARVLAGLFLLGERLLMWSAHEYKTAMEGFKRVLTLVKALGTRINDNLYDMGEGPDGNPILLKIWNTHGEEGFERTDTGQRLKFVARTAGSGRGFSGDVVIIDEAFAYTELQHAALMPTLSARPNPQLIYTSTPPLTGDGGEVLYALRARGEDEDGVQDDSLGWRNWGLDGTLDKTQKLDLDDPALPAATNPALGIRITAETVRRERRSLPRESYCRERLGIWPRNLGTAGGLIEAKVWQDIADPESRRHGPVALGVDVTPLQERACISLYGEREDGFGHLQIVAYGEGTDWVVPKLLELREVLDPLAIAIDSKGGAGALLVELRRAGITEPEDDDHPNRGDLAIPTVTEVGQGVGAFIKATRKQAFRHVGDDALAAAVSNARTRPLGDAVAWGRKQSDVDISPVVSATLARWAYEHRRNLTPKIETLIGSLMA